MLRFNHPLGDHTFFEQVRSLEPGCVMSLDTESAEPRVRRWCSLHLSPEETELRATERLDLAFRGAVKRAVDVDVPYGCYLSGGVDSSGIVAELVNERLSPRLYSLVLPGIRYSEEAHINRVTEALHTHTQKVALEGLTLADYVEYATRAEMPQWWTSDLALAALARRARRNGPRSSSRARARTSSSRVTRIYRVARLRGLLTRAGALVGASAALLPVVRRFVPWLDVDMSVATAYLASHGPSRTAATLNHFGFHRRTSRSGSASRRAIRSRRRSLPGRLVTASPSAPTSASSSRPRRKG